MKQRTARHSIRCLALIAGLVLLPAAAARAEALPCVGGMVDGYPCSEVILMSHLTEADLGTIAVSDNWGWQDPMTGFEYTILAAVERTIFLSLEEFRARLGHEQFAAFVATPREVR